LLTKPIKLEAFFKLREQLGVYMMLGVN